MANAVQKFQKGEMVFREGDPCEAMYVIKSGRIAITKAKGRDEIILAEKSGGEMLGEMGFFDNRPRSAGARALVETEIISLPFETLHAQFKTFPEWLKAMVKTIIAQLRDANSRIKNLEVPVVNDEEVFPPHLTTRLCAILSLVGFKCGEPTPEGLDIPYPVLREYCIQVFQQPTNKLDRLMETLQTLGHVRVEELGEGKKRVTLVHHRLLSDFTDWHNRYVFTEDSKRVTVAEKDLNALRALAHFGRKLTPNHKGVVKVNLTEMQATAPAELKFAFSVSDADPLVEVGLAEEKHSGDGGILTMAFRLEEITRILPFWEIYYALRNVKGARP